MHPARIAAALLVALALLVGAAPAGEWRFTRPIAVPGSGWTRLVIPDDVLAACRPGAPDLRVTAGDDDVSYANEQDLPTVPQTFAPRDVESTPGTETTALIDRGPKPPLADRVTLDVDGTDLLKPVVLEASDDRATWAPFARGSIFVTPRAAATTLRFAPNDRRYWRIRMDDRNAPPIQLRAVTAAPASQGGPPSRTVRVPVDHVTHDAGRSTYALTLPSANLAVTALHLAPDAAAFARDVTIDERVLFRGEITRRVVGGGAIARAPGGAAPSLDVPVGAVVGPALEITIDDGASPPLVFADVVATIAPRSLLFFAPPGASLTLRYGSPSAEAPRYDLPRALAKGRPEALQTATLGAAVDHGAPPIAPPPRGAPIDASAWSTHAPIQLPAGHGVAVLPLEGAAAAHPDDVRIIDAQGRQVPYVNERAPAHARAEAPYRVSREEGRTIVTFDGLASPEAIVGIELTAVEPAYFTREVTIAEPVRDARGVTGERVLGSATWMRKPGDAVAKLDVAVAAPSGGSVVARIEDRENAPLVLGPATVERAMRRIDFLYAEGDSLTLLSGNSGVGAPSYDLALMEGAIVGAPAEVVKVGNVERRGEEGKKGVPGWFWAAVIGAGLVVAGVLARGMGRG